MSYNRLYKAPPARYGWAPRPLISQPRPHSLSAASDDFEAGLYGPGETTPSDRIKALTAALPKLVGRDAEFAKSLIDQFGKRGSLSPKQWPYVASLTEKADKPVEAKVEAPLAKVESFDRILAAFTTAGAKLQHPKLLLGGETLEVKLTIAGPGARKPGTVNIAEPGGFGGKWYGRILLDGSFEPGRDAVGLETSLIALLRSFSADPFKAATDYGRRTGTCCCCGAELTNAESIQLGIGPICRGKWGL